MKPPEVIAALLIDPIKQCIVKVNLPPAIDARWHMLLDCECIELVRIPFALYGVHGLWIDDCGLLRKPDPYPQFKIGTANGDRPMAGYGLLTSLTDGGRGDVASVQIDPNQLAPMVEFEMWGSRLKPDDYVSQLLKLYLPWP